MLAPEDRKGADLVPVHAVGRLVQGLVRLGGEQLVLLQVGDLIGASFPGRLVP